MVKSSAATLDVVFAALSDSTRRTVLESLSEGALPVTELSHPHDMSLPGFMKHLRVLEEAGLIERSKEGRVVQCTLSAEPMRVAASWLSHYQKFWTERLDALDRYLKQQKKSKS
jgi:DNA-binding transcriptional ArsR family regulator